MHVSKSINMTHSVKVPKHDAAIIGSVKRGIIHVSNRIKSRHNKSCTMHRSKEVFLICLRKQEPEVDCNFTLLIGSVATDEL